MSDKEEHHSSDNHKETHNDNDELEIKDDIDDIDTNIQPQEALEKLLGYMDKLSQDERNHLLANLIKNREVNPNKNIYYQARKKEILRERIRQRIEQKRNQRLPKYAHKYTKKREDKMKVKDDDAKEDDAKDDDVDDSDSKDDIHDGQ
jgi:adenylosuccinate lyase